MSHEGKSMSDWTDADWQHAMSGAGGDSDTDSIVGTRLFDPRTQSFIGTLMVTSAGAPFVRRQVPGGDRDTALSAIFQQFGNVFQTQLGQLLELDSRGSVLDSRAVPSGGGGGSRALSLAEQQALIEQQQEFQAGQTAAGQVFQTGEREAMQAFQAEQASLAEENRQRESLQGQAASLLEQWLGIQQQARQFLTQLQGQDPFRAAAAASGQVTRGVTPQMAHEANLRQTVNAQPTFDPSGSVSQLTGQVGALRHQVGAGLPEIPAFVGQFAHGGTIDMEAGRDGTFRAKGQGKDGFRDVEGRGPVSFLVGEEGEEIVTIDRGRVTVAPFMGGFSHGVSFDIPSFVQPSASSLRQATSSAFGHLGFENTPVSSFGRGGRGTLRPFQRSIPAGLDPMGVVSFLNERPPDFTATSLERLGVSPRLVRNAQTGAIFFRSDDGRWMTFTDMANFRQFGFNPNEVVSMSPESLRTLGAPTSPQEASGLLTELSDIGARTEFGPLPFPLLLPVGASGQVPMPDPALIANLFRRLDVAGKRNLLSAYGVTPGITAEGALERIRFFTPSGRAQAGTTASLR